MEDSGPLAACKGLLTLCCAGTQVGGEFAVWAPALTACTGMPALPVQRQHQRGRFRPPCSMHGAEGPLLHIHPSDRSAPPHLAVCTRLRALDCQMTDLRPLAACTGLLTSRSPHLSLRCGCCPARLRQHCSDRSGPLPRPLLPWHPSDRSTPSSSMHGAEGPLAACTGLRALYRHLPGLGSDRSAPPHLAACTAWVWNCDYPLRALRPFYAA